MLLIDPLGDPSGEPLGWQKVDLRAPAERSNGGGTIGRVGLVVLECIEFALGRSAAASASFEEHVADDSDEHGVSDVAPLVDELIGGSDSSASGATVSANGCVALFVFGLLALVDAAVGALGSSASGPSLGWAAHVP
jgi:hypothetical protein